jgi:hypothetical protein
MIQSTVFQILTSVSAAAAPVSLSRLDELVAAVCADGTPLKRKCDCINKIIESVKKQPDEIQNLTRHVPLSVLLAKCVFPRLQNQKVYFRCAPPFCLGETAFRCERYPFVPNLDTNFESIDPEARTSCFSVPARLAAVSYASFLVRIRGFLVQTSVSLKTLSLKFLRLLVLADRTTVQEICRRQVDHFIARCIDSIPAPNPAIPTQTSTAGAGAGGANGNGADGNAAAAQDAHGSPRSGNNQPSGDQESNTSRMAALKLVRQPLVLFFRPLLLIRVLFLKAYTMATNDPSGRFVPMSIVEALKEVARTPEDHCCRVALDTLTHFTIRNPEAAAGAAVLPIIVEAIITPHMKALQDGLLMVVLYLLDSADTRVLFSNLSCTLPPHSRTPVPTLFY